MTERGEEFIIERQAREPQWLDRLEDGLALARKLRRPVAVKPTGQGYGRCDDW